METICKGYTPDNKSFALVLDNFRLYIVTDDSKEQYNDEYYTMDDIGSLRSVKASMISDGYRIS